MGLGACEGGYELNQNPDRSQIMKEMDERRNIARLDISVVTSGSLSHGLGMCYRLSASLSVLYLGSSVSLQDKPRRPKCIQLHGQSYTAVTNISPKSQQANIMQA